MKQGEEAAFSNVACALRTDARFLDMSGEIFLRVL
jgi:hypothetical protein